MKLLRRLGGVIFWPITRSWAWWHGLEPAERILYRAVVLAAIGFGMVAVPLAFIVPAILFALTFFGFGPRRPA